MGSGSTQSNPSCRHVRVLVLYVVYDKATIVCRLDAKGGLEYHENTFMYHVAIFILVTNHFLPENTALSGAFRSCG